jgi:farnesyl-diphosphate farnesyltransferase
VEIAGLSGARGVSASASVEAWSGKDRGHENFPVGSLLIRPDLRRHVHAFYGFARNADDIADSGQLPPEEKIARLDAMEEVLLGRLADAAAPSAARLRLSLAETGVAPRHALDLLHAFRQDATKRRYANFEELYAYCRYSAMPVGRHVLDLHGEDEATHAASDALCTNLQILNHLQDGAADLAALDRCYLPADLMAAHGASIDDLRGARASPGLRAVHFALLARVAELDGLARALPGRVRARRLRLETAVILGLSQRLAARLRRFDPVAMRVQLGRGDVAAAVLGALRFLP